MIHLYLSEIIISFFLVICSVMCMIKENFLISIWFLILNISFLLTINYINEFDNKKIN